MIGPIAKIPSCLKILIASVAILISANIASAEDASVPTDTVELNEIAQNLTPEERMDLLARLSDNDLREMLINYLNQVGGKAATMGGDVEMMDMMESRIDLIRGNFANLLNRFPDIPDAFTQAQSAVTADRGPNHIFIILGFLIAVMAVAYGVEVLFRRMMMAKSGVSSGKGNRVVASILELVAIGVFAIATIAGFLIFYQGHLPSRAVFLTYFFAVMIVRLAMVVSRFVLSPKYPHLRHFDVDNKTAEYWNRSVFTLAIIGAFGFLSCGLMARLGIDQQLHQLLVLIVGVVFIGVLVRAIWGGRQSVADIILDRSLTAQSAGVVRRAFANSWHFLVIAYVVSIFVFAVVAGFSGNSIGVSGVLISLAMVILLPLTDAYVSKALTKSLSSEATDVATNEKAESDISEAEDAPTVAKPNAYARILIRATRFLLIIAAFMILANLWGVDFFGMAKDNFGGSLMRALLDIGITCLIAYVAWELIKAAIDKHLALEAGDGEAAEGEGGGAGGSRLVTLLPLFRKFLLVTIVIMATMIVLSSLGVDIGPMIAGAGVLGLAIGFGAQTLVKDIVSGVFFLVDDAFRVNEYVDVGSVKGTVERINVRSLTLRHHLGPVHTIPFGEIGHLTNFSRDWVIMKMMFRVTYDTDMKKVKKIFKKIGKDMLADETLGPGFLEPFKSQGVKAMEDSAMIIRAKFTAKPGAQFSIRKEAYQRVQSAFKEAGIEFAHRRVSVDLPEGINPKSPEGEAIAEAAGAAVAAQDDAAKKPA